MSERKKKDEAQTSVARSEFVRDPAAVLRMAERAQRPIVITDDRGRPSAIISAPRDELSTQR